MPTKMAKLCREKAVLARVYVQRPMKRRLPSSSKSNDLDHHLHHHHHHYHYVHHSIKHKVTLGKHVGDHDAAAAAGKGYNRRAELLPYSQRLRLQVSAPLPPVAESSSTLEPKTVSSNNKKPTITTNMVAVRRKTKNSGKPCLGNLFGLLTSPEAKKQKTEKKKKKKQEHVGSTSNVTKAVMKSLKVQKKGFISKLLLKLRMHR